MTLQVPRYIIGGASLDAVLTTGRDVASRKRPTWYSQTDTIQSYLKNYRQPLLLRPEKTERTGNLSLKRKQRMILY